jgi:hypothetical protein
VRYGCVVERQFGLIPHHVLWILWRSEDKCYPGGKMPAED